MAPRQRSVFDHYIGRPSTPDRQLLGQTEFEVRDLVHKIGAKAFETALDERKKGGTKAPA